MRTVGAGSGSAKAAGAVAVALSTTASVDAIVPTCLEAGRRQPGAGETRPALCARGAEAGPRYLPECAG